MKFFIRAPLLSFFMLACMLALPLISAWDWDNTKSFDRNIGNYGKYTIENTFGLGGKVIELELKENTFVCGKDCSAKAEIILYNRGILFSNVRFYKIENGKFLHTEIYYNISIKNYTEVKDYGYICSNSKNIYPNNSFIQDCVYKIIGTHNKTSWIPYNFEIMPAGTYTIKLEGRKQKLDTIDWQIFSNGFWTEDWATWGNMSEGATAQVFLNIPNNNTISSDPSKVFNCSALSTANNIIYASYAQDGHGFDLSGTTGRTQIDGFVIYAANQVKVYNMTKSSLSTATKCYIFENDSYTNPTQIDSATFSGDTCSFSSPPILTQGSYYYIGADNEGGGYTLAYNGGQSYPQIKTNIDFFKGWTGGEAPNNNAGNILTVGTARAVNNGATGINNITLILNNQNNFTAFNTTASINLSLQTTLNLPDANYKWTCLACDTDGCGYSVENRTLIIDTLSPSVNITYPINNSEILISAKNANISFSATIYDTSIANCWFYNGTANNSITCGQNTSLNLSAGNYNLYWYGNDTLGNLGSAYVNFSINEISSTIGFISSIVEGENTTIYFYINATSAITSSANLTYNGIVYIMSSIISGNNKTFYKTVTAPLVTENTAVSFSVNYTTDVGFFGINASQLVYNVPALDISTSCSPAALTFNLTDEENLTELNGTFEYNFYYGLSNSSLVRTYGQIENVNSFKVCINETISLNWTIGSGEIFYRSTGWVDRRYYIFGGTVLTNATNNITLHDLLSSRQTSFKLEVESTSLDPYENKYTALIRWYPNLNQYRIVDMGLTDEKGETVIHVRTEDVDYRIGVYELNGTLIKLANPIRMVCLVSPCTYTLKISPTEDDFTSFLNVQYSFTFNETTGIWYFTYSDPSMKVNTMNLTVWKDTGVSSYILCSNLITGISGAVSCNTSGETGSLRGVVLRSASPEIPFASKIVSITTSAFKSTFGLWLSLLLAIPLIFTFAFISPIVAVIGGVVALIPAFYFGSINLGILGGIAILGGIIIHFLKRVG